MTFLLKLVEAISQDLRAPVRFVEERVESIKTIANFILIVSRIISAICVYACSLRLQKDQTAPRNGIIVGGGISKSNSELGTAADHYLVCKVHLKYHHRLPSLLGPVAAFFAALAPWV